MRNAALTLLLGMLVLTLFASLFTIWNELSLLDKPGQSVLFNHQHFSIIIAAVSIVCILIVLYNSILDNRDRRLASQTLLETNETLERKVEERTQALIASEKKYRAVLENNESIIALMDSSLQVIYRTPSSATVTGYTEEERKHIGNFDQIHPEDLPLLQQSVSEILATPGSSRLVCFRNLHKKGHYIWLEGVVKNMLHDPAINAVITNFQDVTDRKKTEEKIKQTQILLRASIESPTNMNIFSVDREYRYLFFNTTHQATMKEYYQSDISINDNILDCINRKENLARVKKSIERALAGEAHVIVSVSGIEQNYFESRYSPIINDKNEIIGVTAFSFEITERVKSEQRLRQSEAQLEEKIAERTAQLKKSHQEMEAFTYSVSHDLRAPLRGIVGFTTILEEEYASKMDAEARRLTGVIKKNTLKMGQLIDELLNFAKVDKQEFFKAEIDMKSLVEEVLEGIHPKPEKVRWELQKLPSILGDINSIRQVWINLIMNAVKYSGNTPEPTIEIGHYRREGEQVFFVKDNGVGFDEQYKDKLFKVFQRLHSAKDFEGTGVGLAIVDKIITKHGGKVWAEGEENKGAVFSFSLPTV